MKLQEDFIKRMNPSGWDGTGNKPNDFDTRIVTYDVDGYPGVEMDLHFEEDDFDKFADRLKEYDIEYVHPIIEHSWGQRVVRFYDPDKHIIEVGENMKIVCKRFLNSGMTPEQVAERMDVPMKFINACMR